jgi:hypothetical protein
VPVWWPMSGLDLIPDAETALKIGRVILERYYGESLVRASEFGLVVRRQALAERDISWSDLLSALGVSEPLDSNSCRTALFADAASARR